jgi:hypothetical protein
VVLVAEGRSAKEIAAILKISGTTVTFHKSNVMPRLGIRTTTELTKLRSVAWHHRIVTGNDRPAAIPFTSRDWEFS